jgi:hypothetical protein
MAWIPIVASIVGSVAGGAMSGAGAEAAGDAQVDAANSANALNREIYLDQRELMSPGYLTGGAATNALAGELGIAPQNYEAALRGSPTSMTGAGQYNWEDYYNRYLKGDTNYQGNWEQNTDLQHMFGGDRNAFARHHYENHGKQAGWEPALIGGSQQTTQPQTPQPVGTGSANALARQPGFENSQYYKNAVEGFRGVDSPEIAHLFSTGGKVMSGAKDRALDDAGKARLGGAYGEYSNALRSLAGLNQTAASGISGAAGSYGANAGNMLMTAGNAKANALSGAYDAWGRGISGAVDSTIEYGDKNWWNKSGGGSTTSSGAAWDKVFA